MKPRCRDPSSLLITGASGGLGRALALVYAAPGRRLYLGGRDRTRLDETVAAVRGRGAEAWPAMADVTDRMAMQAWIGGLGEVPDLVIANAGISAGTGAAGGEDAAQTQAIFAVNVQGVLNTVLPLIAPMRRRGFGQIALISSLAGFRGLPTAPAYAASKAAVRAWGEGLRPWLAADGIGVSVVCPGFVRTPMTARNDFFMPFLMEPEVAAQLIRRGLDANRARIAFPTPLALAALAAAALPPAWVDPLLRGLPKKA